MIVAPTNAEAKLLDRCLGSAAKYVDEICLTITGENAACEEVAKKYNAKVSHFTWENHYAKARNFNFSQATGDWIVWLDCDDILKGGDYLKKIAEESDANKIYAVNCDYLYDFDDNGDCIVRHMKTRLIKNDGALEWAGKLHEDFANKRQIRIGITDKVTIEHYPEKKDKEDSANRNLKISQEGIKESPDDARSWWNYASALMGVERWQESIDNYSKFIVLSDSEDERYIAWDRVAYLYKCMDQYDKAIDCELMAITIRPWYPDAWIGLGELYFIKKRYDHAKFFLLEGLKLKPPVTEIISYNPRMYDFIPLQLLAKVYYLNKQPKEALDCIDTARELFPRNKELKRIGEEIAKEIEQIEYLEKHLEKARTATSREEIKKIIDDVPEEMKHHPMVVHLKNVHFVKTHTSGKEVTIYCAETSFIWGPDSIKTGIGGSEEAIINLTKRWVAMGYDVTVFASVGHKEFVQDGVTWKPHWSWNYRDKHDTLIFWRTPVFCDFDINAKKILIDMHDVVSESEFTPDRLKKIDKIMVKSEAHRALYPHIPDEKFVIIPNGIDPSHFDAQVDREPYRLINTSSADRGLECALDIFKKIKERVPQAEFHWFYGWQTFDAAFGEDTKQMRWKQKMLKKMSETEGFFEHERIGHLEIAKEYQRAKIFFYPTEFYEIWCISAVKAQAAGAIPLVTNVHALKESVQYGWKMPYDNIYSNPVGQQEFADEAVRILTGQTTEPGAEKEMMEWAKKNFSWDTIAERWKKYL